MHSIKALSAVSNHEKEIKKAFRGNVVYDGPAVFDGALYCLGFQNRSGSNLLGGYLRNTPYFSGFQEHLNFNSVIGQSKRWGADSFPDFIRESTRRLGDGKDAHGYKASLGQLMMLERFGIPKMYKDGLKIIHITRNDIVGQAISLQIASQTKRWTSAMPGVMDDADVKFDPQKISRLIDSALESSNGVAFFAELFGYPRLHVSYEEVVASPEQVLQRIAIFSGQDGADWSVTKPEIERQASALNDTFRQKYLEATKKQVM